jgi:PAS domain S-box-containing protein
MNSAVELLVVGTSTAEIERIAVKLKNRTGYQLRTASGPVEARARIAACPAERLVVVALRAERRTLALLEPRDGYPRVAMLVLLDRDDTAATVRALNAGAIDVLVESPAVLDRLPGTIDAVLAKWRQRRAEQLAIDYAARFGHILASALTEIYTFDAATLRFIRVNRGARKNIGYSKQELRKMTPLDLKLAPDRERFEELLHPLRAGGQETLRFESVHRRKDGSFYPVEVLLQFVRVEPPVFIAVCLDISERKQAEEKLQASEARFRSIFNVAAAGMAILTPYGEILEVNPAFCTFSGFAAEELIGRNIADVTHPDDREATADYYAALRRGQDPIVQIDKRYLRKDGQVRWGHASVACLSGRDRSETYCIGLVQDITRHKEAEAKRREAYAELDAFVHTVAHDLRTPLTPIIGIAEYLQEHASEVLDRTSLDFLADIEKSGHRMLALLEDLLTLARVGHVRQPSAPVATRRVVDGVLKSLAGPPAGAGLKVEVGELSPLCLPETLVSQLFGNLIGNALRYAGAAGKPIEVGEERRNGQVIFYVRDHGPGIPEEDLGHIFEAFYRGRNARRVNGTGIGLATVRKIARLYHGDAWVEATPGGGSTFKLGFPLAALTGVGNPSA